MEKREAYIIQPQASEFIVFWLLNVIASVYERRRKKRVIVSKCDGMKKIEESLGNLWNAYAFEEPIVYRICAAARKHVNQLNSTRFPNVIKKGIGNVSALTVAAAATKTTTMITAKNHLFDMLIRPAVYYYRPKCTQSTPTAIVQRFSFALDIISDMFAKQTPERLFCSLSFSRRVCLSASLYIFHDLSCCAFNFVCRHLHSCILK